MNRLVVVCLLFVLSACADEQPVATETSHRYNVDSARITVSGASSGAMMATQFHVAHSGLVGGVGLVAGGPYYCAEGRLTKGLGACMQGGDLNLQALREFALASAESGAVDPLENLVDDRVWLLLGSRDTVVHTDLPAGAIAFYETFVDEAPVYVNDVPVVHGFPTLEVGADCSEFASPYLNACDYDTAGALLQTLYGELAPRGTATGEFTTIVQPGADEATMLPDAFLYVPEDCATGEACGVHVVFHGCQQSSAFVGDAFAKGAGYNEWAETNRLIVLYPQVDKSRIAPMNPMGCWDWWGYTDEHYATRKGAQIEVVKATLDLLADSTL